MTKTQTELRALRDIGWGISRIAKTTNLPVALLQAYESGANMTAPNCPAMQKATPDLRDQLERLVGALFDGLAGVKADGTQVTSNAAGSGY